MKRQDLLNAIDELKDADDICHAIDSLSDIAKNFCDNLEADVNDIRDSLQDLAPHITAVNDAYEVAEKVSCELY